MPWESHGGGYRKASDDDDGRGKGFVRNVPQYEALRDKGMSKERAAAITNAHKKKRGPKRDDDGGASTILVKLFEERPSSPAQIVAYKREVMGKHPKLHPMRRRRLDNPQTRYSQVANTVTGPETPGPGDTVEFRGEHFDMSARQLKPGQRGYLIKADDSGASTILVKTYQPGTITQHQEQARIHRRKARSGAKFTEYAGGAALAAGTVHAAVPEPAVRKLTKPVAYAGAAGALGGLGYSAFHTHRGHQHADAAQEARKQRNATLAKDANRRDAAAAFLGGGAATQGASAVQQHRRANAQRAESSRLHEEAQDQLRVAENRLQRHTMTGKGSLPRRTVDLHSTGKILYTGRAQEHRAAATARNAISANRKAKGRAGMALGLAGAAAAVEHGRTRTPRYSSVGYR